MKKIAIYQVFTRLFGNTNQTNHLFGSRETNGVGKMADFTGLALQEIKALGITHIWFTGIIEHARCQGDDIYGLAGTNPSIVKGRAGSPYAITDYYDVDPDLAVDASNRMNEFVELVDRTHQNGLKVIIDFVPNHVSRVYHSDIFPERDFGISDKRFVSFSPTNDFYYIPNEVLHLPSNAGTILNSDPREAYYEFPAKATGNDQFTANPSIHDWYETVKLNYGIDYQGRTGTYFKPVPPVWDKMVDILKYWAALNVDGFRCDMAEMVPVEFWNYAIPKIKNRFPDIFFIAEVYNPSLYHDYIEKGKFDYLYDKIGLYDTLRNIIVSNWPASTISNCWHSLDGLDSHMLRFMENHDEQRIASHFFASNPFFAIPAMVVSATLNNGPVMLYFGQEVGEPASGASGYSGDDGRTTIFDYYSVPEFQKWVDDGTFKGRGLSLEQHRLRNLYKQLLATASNQPVFSEGKFYDIMWANNAPGGLNTHDIYAYLRYNQETIMLVVVNFHKTDSHRFILKIPEHAFNEMGISFDSKLKFSLVFGEGEIVNANAEQVAKQGILVEVAPSMGKIIKITTSS